MARRSALIHYMKQPPAFQFYVDNFVQGVSDMDQAEVGAYILLLCYQWANGSIPKDITRLERVAGGPVTEHVMAKFKECADGERRNARMEIVRQQAEEFRVKCSEAGKKGGGNPNFKPGQPNPYYDPKDKGIDKGQDKGDDKQEHKGGDKGEINSPISDLRSPSSTPILDLHSPSFTRFWQSYPRKVGKGAAERAFKTHKCGREIERILSAIELQKQSLDWTKESGRFIPHPSTWLNQRRWEDEFATLPPTISTNRLDEYDELNRTGW